MKDRVKNTHICCNCKYWEGVEKLGECSCPKFVCMGIINIKKDELKYTVEDVYEHTNIYKEVKYEGTVETGRKFGCIHFREINNGKK